MSKWRRPGRKFFFLPIGACILIFTFVVLLFSGTYRAVPDPVRNLRQVPNMCHFRISNQTITPLSNTKHLLVSAYMDQRVKGFDVRVISIFKRDSIKALDCLFCCTRLLSTTQAKVIEHSDSFGFPFVTADVLCRMPKNCSSAHVSVLAKVDEVTLSLPTWLPVRNQRTTGKKKMQFDFTVCISSLFESNNVLQFAQTLEMYRLLGVNRVVIYNISCGPDLQRLLRSYSEQGFVEVVPWPINKHLNSFRGQVFYKHGGDVSFFGQSTTLNECVYRSMVRSRYVLLHDISEIMMPYKQNSLRALMDVLQKQHPKAGVFLVENHTYIKKPSKEAERSSIPQWPGVPGSNILENIYRVEPNRSINFHPYKLIVQPRMVAQTSVHEVLKKYGEQIKIPPELCHVIHSSPDAPSVDPPGLSQEDKRLWDFKTKLIPNVDMVLKKVGLPASKGGS